MIAFVIFTVRNSLSEKKEEESKILIYVISLLVDIIPDSDDEGEEEDEYNYNKSQILLKIVMNYIQLVSVIASFEFKWVSILFYFIF